MRINKIQYRSITKEKHFEDEHKRKGQMSYVDVMLLKVAEESGHSAQIDVVK